MKWQSILYLWNPCELLGSPKTVDIIFASFHVIFTSYSRENIVFCSYCKRSWNGNQFYTFGTLESHWEVPKMLASFYIIFKFGLTMTICWITSIDKLVSFSTFKKTICWTTSIYLNWCHSAFLDLKWCELVNNLPLVQWLISL